VPVPRKRIAFSQLVDWVEGRLPQKEAQAMEEQVEVADIATLADVAWLRKFVSATEDSVLESPPPEVRSTLIARFRAHAEGRRTPGLLKRVVATLTFDGGLRPAVGVRSAGTQGARRQLVYSVDDLDVALNFLPRPRQELRPRWTGLTPRRRRARILQRPAIAERERARHNRHRRPGRFRV
jgi:hypothetical protein